jgi:hypothetical protein
VLDTPDGLESTAVTPNAAGGNAGKDEGIPKDQSLDRQVTPPIPPERARSATSGSRPRDHGWQWEWDEDAKDYIHKMGMRPSFPSSIGID